MFFLFPAFADFRGFRIFPSPHALRMGRGWHAVPGEGPMSLLLQLLPPHAFNRMGRGCGGEARVRGLMFFLFPAFADFRGFRIFPSPHAFRMGRGWHEVPGEGLNAWPFLSFPSPRRGDGV